MSISFDRSICCDLHETISREWLVTNGLGGYAAGTVAGVLTRLQHGLLVAMSPDAGTPQLLLAKIDEEVIFDERTYFLGTNEYHDGSFSPAGFVHLEAFRIEDGFPVFLYRLGGIDGIVLEKRIWMPQGYNTTCIQYRVLRTTTTETSGHRRSGVTGVLRADIPYGQGASTSIPHSLTITLLPFAGYRPFNQAQYGNNERHFYVQVHQSAQLDADPALHSSLRLPPGVAGCTIQATEHALPYSLLAVGHSHNQATFIPTGVWYWHILHRQELSGNRSTTCDLYLPGVVRATLQVDDESPLIIVVTAERLSAQLYDLDRLQHMYNENVERQKQLMPGLQSPQRYFGEGGEAAQAEHPCVLPFTTAPDPYMGGLAYLRLLLQAGDRFFARYVLPEDKRATNSFLIRKPEYSTLLLTDYYSMEHRMRDTLIALPGLALTPTRHDNALAILRHLAHYMREGRLPERLPTSERPLTANDYSSVDTTLWYFYALDYYLRTTRNIVFLQEVFPHLKTCIDSYVTGNIHNGIYLDPTDGLLSAQQESQALTWMNAYVDGVPVTPRAGKPVEVNALWYHALSLMHEWSHYLKSPEHGPHSISVYRELLTCCRKSFQQRFWYARGGYLYDVVDGPEGDDSTLRPNQIFALSLRYPVLDTTHWQSVLHVIVQHLLTPYGLRTLAPYEQSYRGHMGEQLDEQQRALHQGSIWPWLSGPYIDAERAVGKQISSKQDQAHCQEHLWRKGLQQLVPYKERFNIGMLGMCEGVADGDDPYRPGPPAASALSTGELLRIYNTLAQLRITQPEHVHSY